MPRPPPFISAAIRAASGGEAAIVGAKFTASAIASAKARRRRSRKMNKQQNARALACLAIAPPALARWPNQRPHQWTRVRARAAFWQQHSAQRRRRSSIAATAAIVN